MAFRPLPGTFLLYLENSAALKGECKKSHSGKISSAYGSLCEHNFFSREGLWSFAMESLKFFDPKMENSSYFVWVWLLLPFYGCLSL